MAEIVHCLPDYAKAHFLRLRNQNSEREREEHFESLRNLRSEAAARGNLRSGQELLAEWHLSEAFIGRLARVDFEAAIETCALYEIPLDVNMSKCIEDNVRAFLVAQYRHAIKETGTLGGSVKIPLHLRTEIASNIPTCRFPIFNAILIDLEKARIEGLRKARDKEARQKSSQPFVPPVPASKFRTATVIHILIASPGDVTEERSVVSECINSWNAVHSRRDGIVLQPLRWETHTIPASGDRPQALINRQIVDEGDCLIGIFGVRLGTPTGEALSGTIEEIERFRKAGKHVALYFSKADVPRTTDRKQLEALEAYQEERQKDTLYFEFATLEELGKLVTQHLPGIVTSVTH